MKLKLLLFFPWFVSIIATLGSLYFSNVKGFIPCDMCWYQRIFMYPLVVLYTFGFLKQDRNVYLYTLPLAIGGLLTAFYHYGVQKFDFAKASAMCVSGVPCNAQYINWFGFVTIPFLSLTAFTLITIVSIFLVRRRAENPTK